MRRTSQSTFILMAFLAMNAANAANTPSKFAKEHQTAAELLHQKKWNEATSAYREIVAKGPNDSLVPNAQYGLFLALDGAQDHEAARKAIDSLEQLVKKKKREGELGGQQPIEAWLFRIRSESARLHEEAGQFAEAAKTYQKAAIEIGNQPQLADWRARAYRNAARCLQIANRVDEAISLLRDHQPDLKRAELAGVRALQTATLAKLSIAKGDKNIAERLLAELKSDPQIDESQLSAAKRLVAGQPWKERAPDAFKMRTRRGPDFLAIESVGRFEIRFALQDVGRSVFGENRYGWIMGWYNLEDDPFKTRNLSGLGFFPLIKPHHMGYVQKIDGDWKRVNFQQFKSLKKQVTIGIEKGHSRFQDCSLTFEVLEDTPTRVRTRTTQDRWPFAVHEYTFYPTGQIDFSATYDLERENPNVRLASVSFYTTKNTRINWREAVEGTSRMSGEGGSQFSTPFVLAHSNKVPSFQTSMPDDILTCSAIPGRRMTFVNNEISMQWRRAPLRFFCDSKAEKQSFALQMRVYPRNIDSFAMGWPYVNDYQKPATVVVESGQLAMDSPGDLNRDGYNESRGCYAIQAETNQIKVTLDATNRSCFHPAFHIGNWSGSDTPQLLIDGNPAKLGVDANVSIEESNVVVHVLRPIKNRKVSITVK